MARLKPPEFDQNRTNIFFNGQFVPFVTNNERYQILMRLFYNRHIDAIAAIPVEIMYEKRDFAGTYSINRAWIIDDDDNIRLQSSCYYLHR